MDLAKRLFKISRDQGGVAVFIKLEEPTTGYIVVYNKSAYSLQTMSNDAIRAQMRNYFKEQLLRDDGIAAWRQNQRQNIGIFRWFATLDEAVEYANLVSAQHVWDVAAKVSTQVNDFALNLPGDGVVEA